MQTDGKLKVLVTLVEAGLGHIVSAQAIADSLEKRYGDKMDVTSCYIMRDSGNPVLKKYESYLVKNVQMYSKYPAFGDIQYISMYLIGPQNSLRFVHNSVFKNQVKALVSEYDKYKPDVIVCTHYFLAYAAMKYKRKVNPNVTVISYCPDNNVHGWWDIRTDILYTNNPMATRQAYELNYPSGHVREAFYPTRAQVVEASESKEFYREKFGLPKDKFAVAIADGVYAMAKAKEICEELLKSDIPLTICLVAGKNEKLRQYFEKKKNKTKPNITLLPFGFVSDAPQLYKACDLFITKAGPNAILDSVMVGTPVIVDFCATPIERASKNLFVKRLSCGYFIVSPSKIKKKVEEIAADPSILRRFDKALSYFDKEKNGADVIADDIEFLLTDPVAHEAMISEWEDAIIDQAMHNLALKKNKSVKNQRIIDKNNAECAKRGEKLKRRFHGGKAGKEFARLMKQFHEKGAEGIDIEAVEDEIQYSQMPTEREIINADGADNTEE